MAAMLATSCVESRDHKDPRPNAPVPGDARFLDRFEDPENGVMCYRGSGETLSCVKVREVK
jgi:hypothetical protein